MRPVGCGDDFAAMFEAKLGIKLRRQTEKYAPATLIVVLTLLSVLVVLSIIIQGSLQASDITLMHDDTTDANDGSPLFTLSPVMMYDESLRKIAQRPRVLGSGEGAAPVTTSTAADDEFNEATSLLLQEGVSNAAESDDAYSTRISPGPSDEDAVDAVFGTALLLHEGVSNAAESDDEYNVLISSGPSAEEAIDAVINTSYTDQMRKSADRARSLSAPVATPTRAPAASSTWYSYSYSYTVFAFGHHNSYSYSYLYSYSYEFGSAPVATSTSAPVASSTSAPVASSTSAPVATSTSAPVAPSTWYSYSYSYCASAPTYSTLTCQALDGDTTTENYCEEAQGTFYSETCGASSCGCCVQVGQVVRWTLYRCVSSRRVSPKLWSFIVFQRMRLTEEWVRISNARCLFKKSMRELYHPCRRMSEEKHVIG